MAQLTQSELETLVKAKKVGVFAVGDGTGLCLRVTRTGASWLLRYRLDNHPRCLVLGKYSYTTLKAAKERARAARVKLDEGKDPAEEKRLAKESAAAARTALKTAQTFSDLAADYMRRAGPDLAPNTLADRTGMLKFDILPRIGDLRLEQFTGTHIVHMLESIGERSPVMARRAFGAISVIFNHGVGKHLCKTNPCSSVSVRAVLGKAKPVREARSLTEPELRNLLPKLDSIGRSTGLALRIILATAVRKNELLRARWEHIDFSTGVWTIPEENCKNGKEFQIPLPPQVVAWFRELQERACGCPWVLPGQNHRDPISRGTLNLAITKLRLKGVRTFTVHDLRRTARSFLGQLGVDIVVAEKCLNHTLGGLIDVYDRGGYLKERLEALEKLSSFLVCCEGGRPWSWEPLQEAA